MGAICSDISAQNCGTRGCRAVIACCLNAGSGSERRASTPAADDWARTTTMNDDSVLMRRVTLPNTQSLSSGECRRSNYSVRSVPDPTSSPSLASFNMSFVALRALPRLARPFATNATAGSEYFANLNALREHAARVYSTVSIFLSLSFSQIPPTSGAKLGMLPASRAFILLIFSSVSTLRSLPVRPAPLHLHPLSWSLPAFVTCAWVYNVESEHAAHEEPLIEENNGTLPQPPPYPYLNRRVKPFPWGSNSLFFNAKVSFLALISNAILQCRTVQQGHGQGGRVIRTRILNSAHSPLTLVIANILSWKAT